MACLYNISGSEFSEVEVKQILKSAATLPGNEGLSDEQLLDLVKQAVEDRFVNINLFNLVQEQSITNAIFSQFVDELGLLKPGGTYEKSSRVLFADIKSKLKNTALKVKYFTENIATSEEAYNALKESATEDMLSKIPELGILNYKEFSYLGELLDNVTDDENFDKFTEQVIIKLNRLGLKVSSENEIQDFGLTNEYYESLLADAGELFGEDDVDVEDPSVNESFSDSRSFQMNPKDTATTRVKLLFSSIKSDKANLLGLADFVPYDQVFEDLLVLGAGLQHVTYESLQEAILEKAQVKPYLLNVHKKLGELQASKNVQLLNEVLTVINKAYTDHTMLLWEKVKEGGVSVKVISSNRNSVVRQIKNDWLELQKVSKLVNKNKFGNLVINTELAKSLKEKYLEIRSGNNLTKKQEFFKELLTSMNIPVDDAYMKHIGVALKANKFRTFKAKSFSDLLATGNVVDNILNTLTADIDTTTESANYEDKNNPIVHERVFNILASLYYDLHSDIYQTGSYQNGENKNIYAYVQPSYLETVKKKLKTKSFLEVLSKRAYSKSSEVVRRLLEDEKTDNESFVYAISYSDSIKEDKKGEIGKVKKNQSPRELILDTYLKHQNNFAKTGYYNMFTLSDKTTAPVIQITKDSLDPSTDFAFFKTKPTVRDSFQFKDAFKNKLYDLAKAEIDRMIAYANYTKKEKLNIANFETASKMFFLFPVLNNRSDAKLNMIRTKIYQGVEPSIEDAQYLKDLIGESIKDDVIKELSNLLRKNIISKGPTSIDPATNRVQTSYYFPFFNNVYMNQLSQLQDSSKAIFAIADLKYNVLRAQINTTQVLGADMALFYKESKLVSADQIKEVFGESMTVNQLLSYNVSTEMTPEEQSKRNIINDVLNGTVLSTVDEFSKRAAMFIAPGSQGTTTWQSTKGKIVDVSLYKMITLKDVIKSNDQFSKIETTDAQEFVTLQEHINRMMSEGRIPLDIYESISDKIAEARKKKTFDYSLSDIELGFVLQPTKPVHSSNSETDGFNEINYVKSSAYPLIPDNTRDSEMDKLRVFMEKNNVGSAAFKTATKTGAPISTLEVFDDNGNFIEPSEAEFSSNVQTLSREGLRTQQEIPHQKEMINVVSQMDRQLFEGLDSVLDFMFAGKKLTAAQLKGLKEQIRVALFEGNAEELLDRIGVSITDEYVSFKSERSLANLLKEEAVSRNLSINDIRSIATNKDGKLVIPVYLLSNSSKFEGLLTSIFSKVVKLKLTGTSLVQVSAVGTKIKEGELSDKLKSEIVYTEVYDASKGLQYIRKEADTVAKGGKVKKGEVQAAQVFMSQFLKDENGKLINIKDFATKDENGRLILDSTRIPRKLLQLIGARIPNQLHSSMLPIEVAGFLPSYMENTIIVPDGITAQMGSDFDVDKLYAYLSNPKYTYKDSASKLIDELTKEKEAIKNKYKEELEKVDGDLAKLLNSEQQFEIAKLNESIEKYRARLGYKNLGEKEREQKQRILDGLYEKRSAVYNEVANGTERKKLNQTKYKIKSQRAAELTAINDKIKAQKSQIESIEPVAYESSISDFKNFDPKSLSEEQLFEMYKDIHWSVLTHPTTFDKITSSIDLSDYNDEKELFYKEGIATLPVNFLPFDYNTQINTFLDNRSGKLGTGIFAQLLSFLAEHQDKKTVGFSAGINIKKDSGEIVNLSYLTAEGNTTFKSDATGKTLTRSKTQNASATLNESLDNAKNKNLNVFNLNSASMAPAKLLMSLSSNSGEIADLRYVTRFFPQFIVKYLNEQEEISKDSFAIGQKKYTSEIIADVKRHFINLLSPNAKELATEENLGAMPVLNPKELLDLLKEEVVLRPKLNQLMLAYSPADINFKPEDRKALDEFIMKQLSILTYYETLHAYSTPQSTLLNNSNVISQGVGSNLFTLLSKYRKFQSIAKAADTQYGEGLPVVIKPLKRDPVVVDRLLNIDTIFGKFETDPISESVDFTPTTQTGHAVKNSIFLAYKVLSKVSPIHFDTVFQNLLEEIVTQKNKGKGGIDNYGRIKFNALAEDVLSNLKAYIYSSPEAGFITGDMEEERYRLLVGTEQNPSLAERILALNIKYPELKNNYFFARLKPVIPAGKTRLSIKSVEYKSPFSQDIDELANNKGFLDLMLNEDPEIASIGKDLIKYAFVSGSVADKASFFRYIPIEVRLLNKQHTDFIGKFYDTFRQNVDNFYEQYIMNNPDMASYIDKDAYKALTNANTVTKDSRGESIYTLPKNMTHLLINSSFQSLEGYKNTVPTFPKFLRYYVNSQILLFKRIGENSYKRIQTLGNNSAYEYQLGVNPATMRSVDFSNLLPSQKLEKIITADTNPFIGFAGNTSLVVDEIELSNYATTAVSFPYDANNPTNKHNILSSRYKGNINTGEYTDKDVVLVSGERFIEVLSPDAKLNHITRNEAIDKLSPMFEDLYVPMLESIIKAKASVVLYSKAEGINTLVKNYLEAKGYKASEIGQFNNIKLEYGEAIPTQEPADLFAEDTFMPQMDDDVVVASMDLFSFADMPSDPEIFLSGEDTNASNGSPIASDTSVIEDYIPDAEGVNTLASVLTKVRANTSNEFYKVLIDSLKFTGDVNKISVVLLNTISDPAIYNTVTNQIVINPDLVLQSNSAKSRSENLEDAIVHELLHGYTAQSLFKLSGKASAYKIKEERMYAASIKQLYLLTRESLLSNPEHAEKLKAVIAKVSNSVFEDSDANTLTEEEKSMYYGLTSEHEFVSMLMTDKKFQEFMNGVSVDSSKKTVTFKFADILKRLLQALTKALGMDVKTDSVLDQGIKNITNLLSVVDTKTEDSTDTTGQTTLFSAATDNLSDYSLNNQCK